MFATILAWVKEYGTWILMILKTYGKKALLWLLAAAGLICAVMWSIDYKIKQVIPPTMEKAAEEQSIEHNNNLIRSQFVYSAVKQRLRLLMRETGCEYIYLIEYHNGSENMATSFPFYKFDVTMDICADGAPYIDTSPLKDEHIFKYDIFDNPEFTAQQFAFCTREEFEKVDSKLYHMMKSNENIQWVYTYNLYYANKLMGAILILSYDEINLKELVNQLRDVEDLFTQGNDVLTEDNEKIEDEQYEN